MRGMNRVVLGGEAVRAGVATRHELARDYTKLYRGVFVRKDIEVTLRDRAIGAASHDMVTRGASWLRSQSIRRRSPASN